MAAQPLQAMDLTSLRAVLAELRPQLVPSRFEKAQQADGQTIHLGFRTLERRLWLELSWLAEAPRLLEIPAPPKQGDGSTLAQQLQHGLSGLALTGLRQEGWERVVELDFAPRPSEPAQRSLVLELMGRHSNLFLLDQDRRVVAVARQVRESQSRLRPISTGDVYLPPPPMGGRGPSRTERFEHWKGELQLLPLPLKRALPSAYQGISPALARQLVAGLGDDLLSQPVQELSDTSWQQLWERWQQWLEALEEERFGFRLEEGGGYCCWATGGSATSLNAELAAYHQNRLQARTFSQRQQSLKQRLERALERERQQQQHQRSLLDQVESSDGLQEQADTLLCQANPSRETINEAQKLYKKARRLRRSVVSITPRLAQHQQQIDQLEGSLTFLELIQLECDRDPQSGLQQLKALEEDSERLWQRQPTNRKERRRPQGDPSPLTLTSSRGLTIQIGRNHRQNEWISLQQARKGDLWFHAQECPGSHVVLKSSAAPAEESDLQAAASLAAHFSRARGNSQVAVVMTPCEQLQRIPGAGPGTVRHRGGEVLWANPEGAEALLRGKPLSL